MPQGSGYAFFPTIVKGDHPAITQWQLDLSLPLLAGDLSGYGTVDFVRQPVFAGHGLQLQDPIEIFVQLILTIGHVLIMTHHGLVGHNGFGGMSEHLGYVQVKRLLTIALYKTEVSITGCLTDDVHRSTFTVGNFPDMIQILLVNQQSHTLLALVADDLLGAESLVPDRQLGHVNLPATILYQF